VFAPAGDACCVNPLCSCSGELTCTAVVNLQALKEFLEPKEENWKQKKGRITYTGVWVTLSWWEWKTAESPETLYLTDYTKQFAVYSVIGIVCHHLM
jgi:hypothetical protein